MPAHTAIASIALLSALVTASPIAAAQGAPVAPETTVSAAAAPAYVPRPWTHKTRQLSRNEVDKLLGQPQKLLVIDLRRPDELVKYGSLPVYLNVQLKDLPQALDYIPRDRQIILVSNRAHRGGVAGDLLSSKGFKVAGALGSETYREAGGTIVKVTAPVPPAAPAAPN